MENMSEALVEIAVPMIVFGCITIILALLIRANLKSKKYFINSIEKQIANGTDISPEVIHALGKHLNASAKDLRRGTLLIAFALGIVAFSFWVDFPVRGNLDLNDALIGIAQIPGLLGVAFLIIHFLNKTR